MLMSDDSPASPSPESLKALNEKHPAASNALTNFTNLVIAGRCPEAVAQFSLVDASWLSVKKNWRHPFN